jgi:hypothetical protein
MKIQTKLTFNKIKPIVSDEDKAMRKEPKPKKLAHVAIKLPKRSIVYFQNIDPDIYMKKNLK